MAALRKLALGALCVPLMLLLSGFFYGTGVNTYNIAGFSGVDCTGVSDSASGLQSAINVIPNTSAIFFPTNCTLHLGSTITISDRVGLVLASGIDQRNINGASAPGFIWVGANNGVMFDVEHSDHITFSGLTFTTNGTATVNRFIKFDGNPGVHPGTLATVEHSDFSASSQTNSSFRAISISETATQNWENSYIHDNTIECGSGQLATNRAVDGVTNGTTTLTSASAAFVSGDAGKRIRLSLPGFYLDTTIASFTNSTTIVLTASAVAHTSVQITTGTNYGTGIYQGASQNAKHSKFYNNQINGCDVGIDIEGGSADIRHLGGGFGGRGIYIAAGVVDAIIIEQYESEGDLRGIEIVGGVAPVTIIGSRVTNVNQLADGFFKFGGYVTLLSTATVSAACGANTNSVVLGQQSGGVVLFSANNQWECTSAQVGYNLLTTLGYVSINDNVDGLNTSAIRMLGLPASAPGGCAGTGRLWNNSGVLTVC